MNNRREQIIKLVMAISQRRDELASMERDLDLLLGEQPNASEVKIESATPKGLTEQVLDYLADRPNESLGVNDLARGIALADEKIASLRSTLVRLSEEGRIIKTSPGMYRTRVQSEAAA